MAFGLAEILAGAVLLFLGVVMTRQETMIRAIAEMKERMQHIPTRKEVSDEVAQTRQIMRAMCDEIETRVDRLERGGPFGL